MKLWPWSKSREETLTGSPLPTTVIMPDGEVIEGKWTATNECAIYGTIAVH